MTRESPRQVRHVPPQLGLAGSLPQLDTELAGKAIKSHQIFGIILMRIIAQVQDHGICKYLLTAMAEIVMKRNPMRAEIL